MSDPTTSAASALKQDKANSAELRYLTSEIQAFEEWATRRAGELEQMAGNAARAARGGEQTEIDEATQLLSRFRGDLSGAVGSIGKRLVQAADMVETSIALQQEALGLEPHVATSATGTVLPLAQSWHGGQLVHRPAIYACDPHNSTSGHPVASDSSRALSARNDPTAYSRDALHYVQMSGHPPEAGDDYTRDDYTRSTAEGSDWYFSGQSRARLYLDDYDGTGHMPTLNAGYPPLAYREFTLLPYPTDDTAQCTIATTRQSRFIRPPSR